jgi:hypothetical protein
MLLKPVPTGVVIGALRAIPFFFIESIVFWGRGVPSRSITSVPASTVSQLIPAPVAFMHLRVASAISGPIPSPVTSVTLIMSNIPNSEKGKYY